MTDDPRIECKTCGDWGEVDVPSPAGEVSVPCPEQCAAFRLLESARTSAADSGWLSLAAFQGGEAA